MVISYECKLWSKVTIVGYGHKSQLKAIRSQVTLVSYFFKLQLLVMVASYNCRLWSLVTIVG
jgi:hypothetical protein